MVAIAVTFDREPTIIVALHHNVDAMLTDTHLRIEGISAIV